MNNLNFPSKYDQICSKASLNILSSAKSYQLRHFLSSKVILLFTYFSILGENHFQKDTPDI